MVVHGAKNHLTFLCNLIWRAILYQWEKTVLKMHKGLVFQLIWYVRECKRLDNGAVNHSSIPQMSLCVCMYALVHILSSCFVLFLLFC